MEKLKEKVERKRRELDNLMVEICAKRKYHWERHEFKEADQLEKAALGIQKANHELFYVETALFKSP